MPLLYFVSVLIFAAIPQHVASQVLNQQVNQLLANNCAGLNPGTFPTPGLGPNLQALCDFPPTGAANSGGGGAASVQGSAASILNRTLLQRLQDNEYEGEGGEKRSSSMRLNPFGSLMGFLGVPSVSSPFFAASGGGASAASFTAGSSSRWHGLGFFGTGVVESLDRNVSTFQDGYKSTILSISGGADYRFSRTLVAGVALSYANTDGDFRNGGTFSTNSYGGLLFASYLPTDKTFLQVSGGYFRNNYLVSRGVSAFVSSTPDRDIRGLASSNSNGDVFNLSLLTGYDHAIGRFTVGPRLGMNYSHTTIHGYRENGSTGIELQYQDQFINSLQSTIGVQGSAAISTGFGVLVPQVNADYIHEFANSQRFIHVQFAEDFRPNATKFTFQNEVPVRNYFNLGTGVVAVLSNGWQPFVQFRAMVGNNQFNNYAGTLGLRVEL
jgi:outer membrane autotransporter protein